MNDGVKIVQVIRYVVKRKDSEGENLYDNDVMMVLDFNVLLLLLLFPNIISLPFY